MTWHRSLIGRKLLLYILFFSSIITLVLTAAQLARDYRIDVDHIDARMQQVELASFENIRESLWHLDVRTLQLQIEGIARLPDIERVTVRDTSGAVLAEVGAQVTADLALPRRYAIHQPGEAAGDKALPLGELEITASLQGVYDRLWDKALIILASQAVKTFLVSLFILFIVYRLVTRHLTHLAHYTDNLVPDQNRPPLKFDRTGTDDELDTVAKSINSLTHNLSQSLEASRANAEHFRRVFEGSLDAILVIDLDSGAIVDGNPRACELLESSLEELRLKTWHQIHMDAQSSTQDFVKQVVRSGSARSLALTCTTARGRQKPTEVSASLIQLEGLDHMLAIVRDRTERRIFERELERLAYNDSLTDLPNRALFNDRLDRALVHAQQHDMRGALLFMDLDNFKTINDSLGHAAGDALLCNVARRLSALLSENDTVARLGGDEFVILLDPDHISLADTTARGLQVSQGIKQQLATPLFIDGQEISTTASIGVTIYPDDGLCVDELLRRADAAMYAAKSDGRNTTSVYRPALEESASTKLVLGAELRRALERDEFFLEYQPLVDLNRLQQVGAEALVRWEHPERGIVPPGEFIPYLEETGLILDVGDWILRKACVTWREALAQPGTSADLRLSVNISSQQFRSPLFIDSLLEVLEETGLDPARLELELTEHSLVRDLDDTHGKMKQLKEIGVALSLDDFGTGYSSLSYIHKLPVDKVKIDRCFVRDIDDKGSGAGLVDTIITLGEKLGMDVVAEGVETEQQANYLRARGCELAQGYLYAAPGREPVPDQKLLRPDRKQIVA